MSYCINVCAAKTHSHTPPWHDKCAFHVSVLKCRGSTPSTANRSPLCKHHRLCRTTIRAVAKTTMMQLCLSMLFHLASLGCGCPIYLIGSLRSLFLQISLSKSRACSFSHPTPLFLSLCFPQYLQSPLSQPPLSPVLLPSLSSSLLPSIHFSPFVCSSFCYIWLSHCLLGCVGTNPDACSILRNSDNHMLCHPHTQTHTHTHVFTHTHTHAHTHTHTHTHKHKNTHKHTHMHSHTYSDVIAGVAQMFEKTSRMMTHQVVRTAGKHLKIHRRKSVRAVAAFWAVGCKRYEFRQTLPSDILSSISHAHAHKNTYLHMM